MNRRRVPIGITLLIIITMLPGLAFPLLLSRSSVAPSSTVDNFLWLYPFYVLASGWLAWYCYGRRSALTWVLIAVMLLTHAAMWLLVDPPYPQML